MKREEIDDNIKKLIGEELEGFMWNCDENDNINAIQLHFKGGTITLLGDTFKILLDIAK